MGARIASAVLAAWLWAAPAFAQARPSEAEPPRDPVAAVPLAPPALVTGTFRSEHFLIEHTARAQKAAEALAPRLEAARAEVEGLVGEKIPGGVTVRLGVGHDQMEALAIPGHPPPRWASALAYPGLQLMLLDAANLTQPEGESTLRHELAHLALGALGGISFPRWFQEGVAMRISGEHLRVSQYAALFRAVHQDRVFWFEDLADGFPSHPGDAEIAYAQSAEFVGFLSNRFGAPGMAALLDQVRAGAPFETAFARAFRSSLRVEQDAWRSGLHWRYGWIPVASIASLLWLASSLLCVVAYVRLRQLVARRRAAQAEQEADEDAAAVLLAEGAEELPAAPDGFSLAVVPDEEPSGPGPSKPTLH